MMNLLNTKGTAGGLRRALVRLHRDEQGAETFEKLLIIAALILPLLGVIFLWGENLKEWLSEKWEDIMGRSDDLDSIN